MGTRHNSESPKARIMALLKRMGALPVSEISRRLELSTGYVASTLKANPEVFVSHKKPKDHTLYWELRQDAETK